MARRAVIVGGSMAGLFAALLLRRAGWDVIVCERSPRGLDGRGAGIVTHPELVDRLRQAGVDLGRPLGVTVPGRVVLDADGGVRCRADLPQILTSWDRVYRMLMDALPAELHRSGMALERVEQDGRGVGARFAGDETIEADLLVGADGIYSTVRAQLMPETRPAYAGYIAWRGLVDERRLSDATRGMLCDRFGFCLPPREQMLGYPVAGSSGDDGVAPGSRRYNFVWYRPADAQTDLPDLLTDASGRRHGPSIPPDRIRRELVAAMRADAHRLLAPHYAEVVDRTDQPFFQPIYDLESRRLVVGRVALIGDAAFVARPHLGMGVTKAGSDAAVLAEALDRSPDDLAAGLAAFEAARMRLGRAVVARARALGAYMQAQLLTDAERRMAESHRDPDSVMRETAVATGLPSGDLAP